MASFRRSRLKSIDEGVAVDTGSIVMIDPAHLFTDKEWREVVNSKKSFEQAIKDKFAPNLPIKAKSLLQVVSMGGDGSYKVRVAKNGDVIIKSLYGRVG